MPFLEMKEHKLCKAKWFAQGQKLIIAKWEPEFRFPGSQFKADKDRWPWKRHPRENHQWKDLFLRHRHRTQSPLWENLRKSVSPLAKMRNVNLRWLQDVTSLESHSVLSSSFNFCYTGLHQYRHFGTRFLINSFDGPDNYGSCIKNENIN